jgi:PKD repeat protein
LQVSFDASGSLDLDGTITKYEFDWDGGGGQGYIDNGTNPLASHTFSAGEVTVFLRVTDNLGAIGTDSIEINAINLSAPPVAVVNADLQSGPAPLTVTFDASFSVDDVGIAKYEWDFDDDGVIDLDSGLVPSAVNTYVVGGSYIGRVIVTDADGQTDSATVDISVLGGTGEPVAVLEANTTLGPGPLTVTLDGSGSFDTDGGAITKYEFDWEGDGLFEQDNGSTPSVDHDFGVGVWTPKLRVTDNDAKTAIAQISVRVYDPLDLGPHAIVYADTRYGEAPLVVNFDGSESFSTEGEIVKYEWDWNGDGAFDLDSGTDATVQHVFVDPGSVDMQLRVTDILSASDTAKLLILPTVDDTFPPSDSIFILPCQSTASAGEVVQIELYCRSTAENLQSVIGRIRMPSGNVYVPDSWGAGDIRGSQQSVDGVWSLMSPHPSGFLALVFPDDPGGGEMTIDFAVAPLDASDIVNATGAIGNLAIEVHTDINFELVRADSTDRTYYQGSDLANRFWSDDDNSGLPGIDLLP